MTNPARTNPALTNPAERYDVVVCGGGLAGLTLSRQLKRAMPELSVLVVERTAGDVIPDGAYKVGEATVEGGAHYFTEQLGLAGHFNTRHLHKLGLRMFFGDAHGPFEARPELGARRFPRVPSYQIDRGIFERELRRGVRELGVDLVEQAKVVDVDLSTGEDDHVVHIEVPGVGGDRAVRARFVVDATGRRRLLQRKLELGTPSPHKINAVWWRFRGEYDVERMTDTTSLTWRPKTQERRWFSTNHLMGAGYWVWMIPLSSGNTSIGLVTDERIHPFSSYATEAKARQWLAEYEPTLATFIRDAEPIDFLRMRNASYGSRQIFSHHRWACLGEAAVFLDAFYSPGSDFIAYTNHITTRLIELDRAGRLTADVAATYNRLMLEDLWPNYLAMYHENYPSFGSAPAMFTKVMWDTSFYWALPSSLLFHGLIANEDAAAEFHPIATRFQGIQHRMQANLRAFAAQAPQPDKYLFVEYSKIPICAQLHLDLLTDKTATQAFRDMRRNVDRLEAWAESFEQEVGKQYDLPQREPAVAVAE
ncbi:NAD(P)/FAD-dependent oxidoreductase [Nocardia otitidiscaviarum]|uniref:NAD(P)/FAD-dependent oxidoreductase n=1 Tax=Nocardia otitidiscaviarum TaxID=1823 RepID=A0A516NQP9_9NOCA|nr:NAD(P)/FAD-dependent oxidoreductase [Nocardia otitidiscaviarum]MCP9620395.1 NAD(P)/FAD-dependent oxidoreductase [Nocardia otitidiscaviarum]QDP81230.1 NAD(P)/FAD-dependent oxidoreductase [Nocardia otitidiscaviarum]